MKKRKTAINSWLLQFSEGRSYHLSNCTSETRKCSQHVEATFTFSHYIQTIVTTSEITHNDRLCRTVLSKHILKNQENYFTEKQILKKQLCSNSMCDPILSQVYEATYPSSGHLLIKYETSSRKSPLDFVGRLLSH